MTELEEINFENNQQILEMKLIEVFGMIAGTMISEKCDDATLIVKGIATEDMEFDFKVTCNLIQEGESFLDKIKRWFK